MKFTSILLVLTLTLAYSCNNAPERPGAILDENYEPIVPTNTPPPAASTPEPAQNGAGVWHYTCPTGCTGGAGSAVPCGTCGTTLVHNTAYHNNGAPPAVTTPTATTTIGGTPTGSITNPIINGLGNTTPPPAAAPKTPEPAQNAAGVWHYTCSAGCAGGAGSAVACAGCGATLVHNTAYHN